MTLVNAPLRPNIPSRNMSNETMNNDFVRYDLLNISDYEVLYGDIITSTIHNASCQTLENFTGCTQGNTTEEDGSSGYFYKVEQLTFLWILLTVIVMGNSMVIITLLSTRARRSRMNFFIMHLAAADLSVGLLSVSTDIVWKLTMTWEAGLLACKVIRFLQVVVTYASTYVLVALSIDRYDAITHPMNFSGSWKRAKFLVAAAWVLSIAFSVPIIFFYKLKETEQYGNQCWIEFPQQWHWKLYMTLVAFSLFVIPAICIASCYFVIVITIWKKGKVMAPPTVTQSLLPRVPLTEARRRKIALDSDPDCRRASSRGLIPKAKVKTIKMTFVIVFVFILCWSPYILFDLLQVYQLIPSNQTTQAVATFIQSLAPLNSAANPIIYCIFSANLGKYISNLWCRRHCCRCCSKEDELLASNGLSSSGLRTTSTLLSSSNGHSVHNTSNLSSKVSQVQICAATIAANRY